MNREQKRELAYQLTKWWMRLEQPGQDPGVRLSGREAVELQNFLNYIKQVLNIPRG